MGDLKRIPDDLRQINSNMEELREDISLLGTSSDNADLRKEMKSLRESTQTIIKRVQSALHSSVAAADKAKRNTLLSQFGEIVQQYDKLADLCLRKEREIIVVMQESFSQKSDAPIHLAGGGEFGISIADMGLTEIDHQLIDEQNEDIRQIEQDVAELAEIFGDIQTMVEEQGEELEKIDEKVEETIEKTEGAVYELKRSYHAKKIGIVLSIIACLLVCVILFIICVVVVVILAVIAIVLAVVFTNNGN